jgi:hypothetical protein
VKTTFPKHDRAIVGMLYATESAALARLDRMTEYRRKQFAIVHAPLGSYYLIVTKAQLQ